MLRNTIIILIGLVVMYVLFLYITYTDTEITTGEYHGYEIGMSKERVYEKVVSEYKTSDFFVMFPLNENGVGPLIQFDQDIMTYEYMKKFDLWSFYFHDNYHNVIKLNFSDEKLVKIYRHRKYFEFP